jgi:hypothetical protein
MLCAKLFAAKPPAAASAAVPQASISRRLTAVTANDPLQHPHTVDKFRFDTLSMIDPPISA